MIVGANRDDAHLRGVKMGRDFEADEIAPLSMVLDGDWCKACGDRRLYIQRGSELGHRQQHLLGVGEFALLSGGQPNHVRP